MNVFKHVLIAIDFSETTESLLRSAHELRELRELGVERVTLLHVQPVGYPGAPQVTHQPRYVERLQELGAGLESSGFEVEPMVRAGPPGSEIAAVASELGAHLILLAAHEHGRVLRGLLGSVASETLQHATVPVLLARFPRTGGEPPGGSPFRVRTTYSQPLLATDGSESARGAEALARQLSARAHHTILVTVHEGTDQQEGHSDLQTLAQGFEGEVEVRVERGRRASEEIGRVAEEEEATLILMGRTGRGGIVDRLLGSTAEHLAQQVGCSVLVVP